MDRDEGAFFRSSLSIQFLPRLSLNAGDTAPQVSSQKPRCECVKTVAVEMRRRAAYVRVYVLLLPSPPWLSFTPSFPSPRRS